MLDVVLLHAFESRSFAAFMLLLAMRAATEGLGVEFQPRSICYSMSACLKLLLQQLDYQIPLLRLPPVPALLPLCSTP